MMTIELGNQVVVSDPCYNLGTWCQGVLSNVKTGKWICDYEREFNDEGRVSRLIVRHLEHPNAEPTKLMEFEVGVDSGTAGIFDYEYYAQYHDPELDENWYEKYVVCEIDNPGYITEGKGFWTESGYGDGGYNCYVSEFNGEIVAIGIVFIEDYEDEEYEEDDYDENYE